MKELEKYIKELGANGVRQVHLNANSIYGVKVKEFISYLEGNIGEAVVYTTDGEGTGYSQCLKVYGVIIKIWEN